MIKITFASLLLLTSCGYDTAHDQDPRYCAHEYPIEATPTLCESNSSGDCCFWEDVETEDGVCRYDYCSFYETNGCKWELQYKNCVE